MPHGAWGEFARGVGHDAGMLTGALFGQEALHDAYIRQTCAELARELVKPDIQHIWNLIRGISLGQPVLARTEVRA